MHTLTLKLNTTKSDALEIEKRFRAVSHIHNVCVKHAKKQIGRLKHDPVYKDAKAGYASACKNGDLQAKKEYADIMDAAIKNLGLTEYGLQSYIKVCGRQFKKMLSSTQVQKEASRVWTSVERYLYKDGECIHFKRYEDFTTIPGKSPSNGIKFDREALSIEWLGLNIPCRVKMDAYKEESLSHKIKYCELKRQMFNTGWRYYVVIYLDGEAPAKLTPGQGRMGIDPGVSTIAAVSEKAVFLEELAPSTKRYDEKIELTLQQMDASRRAANPGLYNEDGTVKQGRHKWAVSNNYRKLKMRLKTLYRQRAAYIRQSHFEQIKKLIKRASDFVVESMNYKSLQARSKGLEREDALSEIKLKDGTVKAIHKYKRRKHFGRSLNVRAPAMFITLLKQKCRQYGLAYHEINTRTFKASQYNHLTDTYEKPALSDRSKIIGRHKIQRDLYSAFLISNTNSTYNHTDKTKAANSFQNFLILHDNLIQDIIAANLPRLECFGF